MLCIYIYKRFASCVSSDFTSVYLQLNRLEQEIFISNIEYGYLTDIDFTGTYVADSPDWVSPDFIISIHLSLFDLLILTHLDRPRLLSLFLWIELASCCIRNIPYTAQAKLNFLKTRSLYCNGWTYITTIANITIVCICRMLCISLCVYVCACRDIHFN